MKRAFKWLWEYVDPLVATIAAFVVLVLFALGVIEGETLTAVTLAVLAVIATTMLRSRQLVEEGRKSLDLVARALGELRSSLEANVPDAPYLAVFSEQTWDLLRPDGSLAVMQANKRLRFTQNGVLAVKQFAFAEGTIEGVKVIPPRKVVDEIRQGGRAYSVISLGREYNRNDEEDVWCELVVADSFTSPSEYVSALVQEPTQELLLRVIWPPNRPPTSVSLELPDAPVSDIPLAELTPGSRLSYEYRSHHPPIGGQITIRWRWDAPPPNA